MRDDLKLLFQNILSAFLNKNSFLNKILLIEQEVSHVLINNIEADVNSKILLISEYIENVNIIDYELAKLKENVCKILAIEYHEFLDCISKIKNEVINEILKQNRNQNSLLSELMLVKNSNQFTMRSEMKRIQTEIEELKSIQNMKLNYKDQ